MKNREEIIRHLSDFVSENRYKLFQKVLENRTRYLTVVLEDIFQSQNASAVLRSCDCFGIQNVHVIENRNVFDVNPNVSLGSSKWLSIKKYNEKENNTACALDKLKADGYRIVATTPHKNDIGVNNFDLFKGKTALVFGTEMKGISGEVEARADEFLKIPMYGFTESFNISVSVAIILHHLTNKLHQSSLDWKLTENEREELMLEWLMKTIKRSEILIREYNKRT